MNIQKLFWSSVLVGSIFASIFSFSAFANTEQAGIPAGLVDKHTGEERPALPADNFPANTGARSPDLSLIAKGRTAFHGPYGMR